MTSFLLRFSLFFMVVLCLCSCEAKNPNVDQSGTDELESLEIEHEIPLEKKNFQDLIYVPIYSDIYIDQQNVKAPLSATLSIRNTSFSDSLFISKIDYYNTDGKLVRKFIKNPISLTPMASLNYVIEKYDDTGGHGANFIVDISAKNRDIRPIIQAIMIGQHGNKGIAFSTDGYSIKRE